MTLNFGGGLFPQRDVRETPASTATASLTGVESAISGTGVDVDVATGDVTFTSNDGEINHDNLSGFAANEHRVWEDSIAQNIHADNYTDTGDTTYTAGEGLDLAGGVFSGEDATTTNKGIASFNTNDFAVSTGAVSLVNKTSYLNIPGASFSGDSPDTDQILKDNAGSIVVESGASDAIAGVQLPNGAVVTAVVVYGTNTGLTWYMVRSNDHDASGSDMATAAINTEDTSITNGTIDNSAYKYHIWINNLESTVYSARITYTTDYD